MLDTYKYSIHVSYYYQIGGIIKRNMQKIFATIFIHMVAKMTAVE